MGVNKAFWLNVIVAGHVVLSLVCVHRAVDSFVLCELIAVIAAV